MQRFFGLLAAMILTTTIFGCGGAATGPNTGTATTEVPKEQKETDDLMHAKPAPPK